MSRRSRWSAPFAALTLLPIVCTASAQQPVRIGSEFQVNAYTNDTPLQNNQGFPAVALDADGDFVIAWGSMSQDGGNYGVFLRRYASTGALLVDELQVNSYTQDSQRSPAVASAANGSFVVTWQSYQQDGHPGYGIFAKRFTSSGGALLAGDLQVHTYVTSTQFDPAVANEDNGDFVVVWYSVHDGSPFGIFGQLFTSSGSAANDEFQVNTYTENDQRYPAVAADADGDFVVVWRSYQDGSLHGIFGQRFASSGAPRGTEFQVNTHTTNGQANPAVAMDADGDFVVAWGSPHDGSSSGVFARRFSSAGAPQGGELQVNIYTTGSQDRPVVGVDADGDFVVAWESAGQDGQGEGIFGRSFSSAGAALTAEFQINTRTLSDQYTPAIGVDADGDFVVAWGSYGQDDTGAGVFAQRFGGPLTLDIDGNGQALALSDGLLVLRRFFTLGGTALTSGVIGSDCTRCDAAAIEPYIAGLGLVLDVDGNGATQPLADGILIVRYLFTLRGTALTSGAVGAGCTRCDATAIEPYLANLVA